MKNLGEIVDKIEQNINGKDKSREKALASSRYIIINSRKAVQCLHQNLEKKAIEYIGNASDELTNLYDDISEHSELRHAGFVENAAQEVVEAKCFLNIMKNTDLPTPDEINTTYSAYLLGLCDVVGELRRSALDSVRNGNNPKANEYLDKMEQIYDAIIRFDYPSGLVPIRKKQDMVRNLIEKTRGELAVASCEQRIEYHTDEFRGLLDKINGEKKKRKKQNKEKSDLNIDEVW